MFGGISFGGSHVNLAVARETGTQNGTLVSGNLGVPGAQDAGAGLALGLAKVGREKESETHGERG